MAAARPLDTASTSSTQPYDKYNTHMAAASPWPCKFQQHPLPYSIPKAFGDPQLLVARPLAYTSINLPCGEQ